MVSVGMTFVGVGSKDGIEFDVNFAITKVDGNKFEFTHAVSFKGAALEETKGSGTFTENGDVITLTESFNSYY